jgi:MFS transporter
VALPTLQESLDFSSSSLQWVIDSYTLCFGGFLLLGGRAADLFGRKRLFLAGVVVFTLASLLDGFATNSGFLIAARALQGLGRALVSPAALSTAFADGAPRAKALGVWSAIAVGGGAVGLLLGGILTEARAGEAWRPERPIASRRPERRRPVAAQRGPRGLRTAAADAGRTMEVPASSPLMVGDERARGKYRDGLPTRTSRPRRCPRAAHPDPSRRRPRKPLHHGWLDTGRPPQAGGQGG